MDESLPLRTFAGNQSKEDIRKQIEDSARSADHAIVQKVFKESAIAETINKAGKAGLTPDDLQACILWAASNFKDNAIPTVNSLFLHLPQKVQNTLPDKIDKYITVAMMGRPNAMLPTIKCIILLEYYFENKTHAEIEAVLDSLFPDVKPKILRAEKFMPESTETANMDPGSISKHLNSISLPLNILYGVVRNYSENKTNGELSIRNLTYGGLLLCLQSDVSAKSVIKHRLGKSEYDDVRNQLKKEPLISNMYQANEFQTLLAIVFENRKNLHECFTNLADRNPDAADTLAEDEIREIYREFAAEVLLTNNLDYRWHDKSPVITRSMKDKALDIATKYVLERYTWEYDMSLEIVDDYRHHTIITEGAVSMFIQCLITSCLLEMWKSVAKALITGQQSGEVGAANSQHGAPVRSNVFVQENEKLHAEINELHVMLNQSNEEIAALKRSTDIQKGIAAEAQKDAAVAKKASAAQEKAIRKQEDEIAELRKIISDMQESEGRTDETQDTYTDYHEELLGLAAKYKIVVVGGNENLISKISVQQPDITFLGQQGNKRTDDACSSADIVFFKYDCLAHKIYWKAKNAADDGNVPMRYVCANTSIPNIERDMVEKIHAEFPDDK